jgi:hypothetical protein
MKPWRPAQTKADVDDQTTRHDYQYVAAVEECVEQQRREDRNLHRCTEANETPSAKKGPEMLAARMKAAMPATCRQEDRLVCFVRQAPQLWILPFQGEASFEDDLEVANLAVFDVTAGLYDLKPAQVSQRFVRSSDCHSDGVLNAICR